MARLLGLLTGRTTYRRWLYLLGGGALAFAFLAVTLPVARLATVVVPPAAAVVAATPFGEPTTMTLGSWAWRLPSGPGAAWLVLVALAAMVALVLLAAGAGALLAGWAPAFLGPSPAERLGPLDR
jgi:hypothetical protein